MKFVYHSSSTQGLKRIEPNVSTHGNSWVYATKNKAMSAIFLSHKGGDMTMASGVRNDKPFLCERFEGAFQFVYSGKSGSIYTLSGDNFEEGKTSFKAEVVSEKTEKVLDEEIIDDVERYISQLIKNSEIDFFEYPSRPAHIPQDDSDLVDKAARWAKDRKESVVKQIQDYHPQLLDRVLEKIESTA